MDEAKVKALADLLGIPADQVSGLIEQTQTKEKAIEQTGVAFKGDEPTTIVVNGVTYQAVREKADTGMAITEDALPPDAEDLADGGADEADEPDGDENMLTMAECQQIAQMTAQAVIEQLMPHLGIGTKVDELKSALAGMQGSYAKKDAEQADQRKAQQDEIASLKARLLELEGDQPKGGGYRASLDTKTVVKSDAPAPAADPLNDFIGGFVLGANQQPPVPA